MNKNAGTAKAAKKNTEVTEPKPMHVVKDEPKVEQPQQSPIEAALLKGAKLADLASKREKSIETLVKLNSFQPDVEEGGIKLTIEDKVGNKFFTTNPEHIAYFLSGFIQTVEQKKQAFEAEAVAVAQAA